MDNQKYDGATASVHHSDARGTSSAELEARAAGAAAQGGNLTGAAAAVSAAYPNGDQAMIAKNTAEINDAVAKASVPKLVRHLMQQRIDEAQHEVKRLQHLLDTSDPALLDCTLDAAMKIFG